MHDDDSKRIPSLLFILLFSQSHQKPPMEKKAQQNAQDVEEIAPLLMRNMIFTL
jgi:hypothetical protein